MIHGRKQYAHLLALACIHHYFWRFTTEVCQCSMRRIRSSTHHLHNCHRTRTFFHCTPPRNGGTKRQVPLLWCLWASTHSLYLSLLAPYPDHRMILNQWPTGCPSTLLWYHVRRRCTSCLCEQNWNGNLSFLALFQQVSLHTNYCCRILGCLYLPL